MKKELQIDIKTVIDYLWHSEKRHWEEVKKPKDHIFCKLKRIKENLKTKEETKENFVKKVTESVLEEKDRLHKKFKKAEKDLEETGLTECKQEISFIEGQLFGMGYVLGILFKEVKKNDTKTN